MVKKFTEVSPYTGRDIDEGPTNTTGPSVAGTGDDSSTVVVRKKKKDTLYDGRTKHAKRFVERILKMREKRKVSESKMSDLHAMIADGSSAQEISKELKIPLKTVKELMKGFKEEVELGEGSIWKVNVKKSGTDFDVIYKGNTKYGRNKLIGYFSKSGSGFEVYHDNEDMKDDFQQSDFVKTERQAIDLIFDTAESNGVIKENKELEEALKPKDKKVVDAFYDGKSMKGDTLSTDGKKLEKSGLGAQTIATSSGGKFKVVAKMDGKHTQSVVSYIKKSFPKNVVEEITEGTMASGIFSNDPKTSNKSGYELTKFFKKKPNAKQAYDFVEPHIPDDILGDDMAALAGELDDVPGRLKDFPYKKQKKAYSKIDPRSVILNRLADFTDDKNAMLLVKTLMNMGVKPIKLGTGRSGKGEYDPIKMNINPSKIDAILKKFGVSDPKQISFKEETMEITEEVMTLKTKDNVMGLKVFNGAKGLGLKAALLGKYVRVKGSKKQVNDFGRTVIGKSSMGSPTDVGGFGKGSPTPQEDRMLNKRLKEELEIQTTFTASILEKVNDFGNEHELVETNLKVLQNIVKKKQNQKVKFKDKQATVDLFTASAIMKVYDAVKPDNKKKIEKLMNGTLVDFLKLQKFAMKQVKFA